MTAGTIDALPTDHYICDCERAYIATHAENAAKILKISGATHKELRQLWHRIAGANQ